MSTYITYRISYEHSAKHFTGVTASGVTTLQNLGLRGSETHLFCHHSTLLTRTLCFSFALRTGIWRPALIYLGIKHPFILDAYSLLWRVK